MPSREKIVSMSRLPVKKAVIKVPGKPVIIGLIAFLKTCL
jgi:hypothetical protein